MTQTGFKAIFVRSVLQIVRRPLYWMGFFILPLFVMLFFTDMLEVGLPMQLPMAMVDKDGSPLSREVSHNLASMQLVEMTQAANSYTEAHDAMKRGEIYGFFVIPENFQADLLAGRKPALTFYTNMAYYIPGTMLMRAFSMTALLTKAGTALKVVQSAGIDASELSGMMMPINTQVRALHNPGTNYAVYLSNSFVPCTLQLMIMLITCFSVGQEMKYGTSRKLLRMAGGNIWKALAAKLLPQTIIWLVVAMLMEAWLFRFMAYPVNGSWFWLTVSEIMFVLASQAYGLMFFMVFLNLRMALSSVALLGILAFSLTAISMPVQSMYSGLEPFAWIFPFRYNFLIYADQALDGVPVYYSRVWFAAYVAFMVAPLPFIGRLRKAMARPVYVP